MVSLLCSLPLGFVLLLSPELPPSAIFSWPKSAQNLLYRSFNWASKFTAFTWRPLKQQTEKEMPSVLWLYAQTQRTDLHWDLQYCSASLFAKADPYSNLSLTLNWVFTLKFTDLNYGLPMREHVNRFTVCPNITLSPNTLNCVLSQCIQYIFRRVFYFHLWDHSIHLVSFLTAP